MTDKDTKPEKCINGDSNKCEHMKCTYSGWESESYRCEKCKESYRLYDDEMR